MCIPKQEPGPLPPSNIPSLQSASALQIGSARGSAQSDNPLGRLKLRLSGKSPAPATQQALGSSSLAIPTGGPKAASSEFQYTPNPDLRIPIGDL